MSPRIPEDRPRGIVLERDGFRTRVCARGGDLTWRDVAALIEWRDRHANPWREPEHQVGVISLPLLRAIVAVMQIFPGAAIEGDPGLPMHSWEFPNAGLSCEGRVSETPENEEVAP